MVEETFEPGMTVSLVARRRGATHFLMKRLPKVASEMALHVLAYNLDLDRSLQRGSPAQGTRLSFTPRVHRNSRKSLTVSGRSGATTSALSRPYNHKRRFDFSLRHLRALRALKRRRIS